MWEQDIFRVLAVLLFLHGDGDHQLFGSLSLNGERRRWLAMALPLLSSFYTWFVCVVCVLVDKVSMRRILCGGNVRRMDWNVWSEGFKVDKELEKKTEKLSIMFFPIMLLDVASGFCDLHRDCIQINSIA